MIRTLRVATRGSDLALRQTDTILALLRARQPGLEFERVVIATHGDRFQDVPIAAMGQDVEKGIFNTALEQAVLRDEADFATCSYKDVESDLPPGLTALPVGVREAPWDALVSRHGLPLERLPQGAVLATSSPRRVSQLAAFRADLKFQPLRGNVTTRVEKDAARYDGVVLAAAGLRRLGLDGRITQLIPERILLPAPAQGALACEFAAARADVGALLASIQDADTALSVRLEKALLVRLSGGCFAPVGVLANIEHGQVHLRCRVASLDGREKVEQSVRGPREGADALIERLAEQAIAQGAQRIVQAARAALQAGD